MKLGLFALAAAFLLASTTLGAGCGSGTRVLTLGEYFAEFEAIDADIDDQIDALYVDFPEDVDALTDDANLPYFKELAAAFTPIMAENVDRLSGLEPPVEAADEHNDLVAAGKELLATFEEGAEVIDEAETMTAFEALNSEITASLIEPIAQFNTACLELVDIAEANNIPVSGNGSSPTIYSSAKASESDHPARRRPSKCLLPAAAIRLAPTDNNGAVG